MDYDKEIGLLKDNVNLLVTVVKGLTSGVKGLVSIAEKGVKIDQGLFDLVKDTSQKSREVRRLLDEINKNIELVQMKTVKGFEAPKEEVESQ